MSGVILCDRCGHYRRLDDDGGMCQTCLGSDLIAFSVKLSDLWALVMRQCVEPWAVPVVKWLEA